MNKPVAVWEFEVDDNLAAATIAVLDGLVEPQFQAVVLSSTGDVLTIQVTDGKPTTNTDTVFYVERRGIFRLLRWEEWPAILAGGAPRVLLVLRAWPDSGKER